MNSIYSMKIIVSTIIYKSMEFRPLNKIFTLEDLVFQKKNYDK